jgi:Holliday junction resolvase RusA-like endonuclease
MFTLEREESNRGVTRWREFPILYKSVEDALEHAAELWEDDDVLVSEILVKKTVVLCRLQPPRKKVVIDLGK